MDASASAEEPTGKVGQAVHPDHRIRGRHGLRQKLIKSKVVLSWRSRVRFSGHPESIRQKEYLGFLSSRQSLFTSDQEMRIAST